MRPHKFRRARTRPRSQPGTMNKTEQAYAEVLEERRMLGQITGWRYEAIRFKLAGNTHYTPDFWVQLTDGSVELHEVKACRANGAFLVEDDARVKIKVAAEMYHEFEWRIVGRLPKKAGGGWRVEVFGGSNE
jgi:uncharacterized Zn finger protein